MTNEVIANILKSPIEIPAPEKDIASPDPLVGPPRDSPRPPMTVISTPERANKAGAANTDANDIKIT